MHGFDLVCLWFRVVCSGPVVGFVGSGFADDIVFGNIVGLAVAVE
jgi:hypothetical protein